MAKTAGCTPFVMTLAAALTVSLLPWHEAGAQNSDRITSFILSSGGLAQIERQVRVADQAVAQLPVPLEQIDDVLKSLVVHDPAGHVTSIVLDGEAPVQEAFSRLPFGPEDLASAATLASSLQGVPVRAASGGRTVQGTVLGVQISQHENDEQAVLTVMSPEGLIQTLRLGADTVLEIMDEAMRARLQEALQASAQRQSDTMRLLNVSLSGQGERDVGFTYVVPAPVWKSAYRLAAGKDGKARLQAWAVLENASGQDWKDVQVTLVSGAPVTLSQKLYQRYWHNRPELPVAVGAAEPPRVDTSAMTDMMVESAPSAPVAAAANAQMRMAARQRPLALPAPAPQEAVAPREGQTSVYYQLPQPVSVAAGQTVSLPFIDTEVQAEQVSVFQPQRGSIHPVAAVWLKNNTSGSLPPGILTVYDDASGHLGDAQLASIPVGESRFLYFAEDGKVEVRSEQQPQERLSELSISQGVLRAQRTLRQDTQYTVKGAPDAPRTVLIEQPRRTGWKFESKELAGETATHYRMKVNVPAGGSATVHASMTRQEPQTVALLDADEQTLAAWSTHAADDRTRRELERLAQLRQALSEAQRQEQALEGDLSSAEANQARIRDNLAAVPADSTLGQRYLSMLEKEEDGLQALRQRKQAAQQETASRRRALEQALSPA